MKNCEKFEALLDAFVDGELSPEELQAVQTHLDSCPDCRAYVDGCLAIRAAFPTVEETKVPAGFCEGVMAKIAAQTASVQKKHKQPWAKLLLPVAACFAIVLAVKTAAPPALNSGAAEEPQVTEARIAPEAEAPAAEDLREALPAEAADLPSTYAIEDTSPYFTELTLTAEEADSRFAALSPLEETENYTRYALPLADYQTLVEELTEQGKELPTELPSQVTEDSMALITVLK